MGSFDPFTIGHDSIVRRALPLFDRLVIRLRPVITEERCQDVLRFKLVVKSQKLKPHSDAEARIDGNLTTADFYRVRQRGR